MGVTGTTTTPSVDVDVCVADVEVTAGVSTGSVLVVAGVASAAGSGEGDAVLNVVGGPSSVFDVALGSTADSADTVAISVVVLARVVVEVGSSLPAGAAALKVVATLPFASGLSVVNPAVGPVKVADAVTNTTVTVGVDC